MRVDLALAARATTMLRWGLSPAAALHELGPGDPDARDAVRLAELRVRATPKFRRAADMLFDEVGLETATPEEVARYRAGRLASAHALDLGCGIGGDTVALAATCGRVTAVEEDEERLAMARHNASVYGAENVTFVRGDALVHAAQTDAAVVFADPLRRKDERRVSALDATLPPASRLVARLGERRFALEVSSRLAPGDLRFGDRRAEREWAGWGGEANCCTLYFGDLARCDTSAVVLPGAARLERAFGADPAPMPAPRPAQAYLFAVHDAVTRAGLDGELARELGDVGAWGDAYLTGPDPRTSPFFPARFEVLGRAPLHEPDLLKVLKQWGAGKVVLRRNLPPSDHARITRSLNARLSGPETITVFDEGGTALLARFLG